MGFNLNALLSWIFLILLFQKIVGLIMEKFALLYMQCLRKDYIV